MYLIRCGQALGAAESVAVAMREECGSAQERLRSLQAEVERAGDVEAELRAALEATQQQHQVWAPLSLFHNSKELAASVSVVRAG